MILEFFSNITFEYPYVLLAILIFIICSKLCPSKEKSYYIPHLHLYPQNSISSNALQKILKWLAIILSIIALASPIKKIDEITLKSEGIDIILALDTSHSMAEKDLEDNQDKTRFDVVKQIVIDFIDKRKNDNIGIIVFGDYALNASPLSYDKHIQKLILNRLEIGMAGRSTALNDALALGIKILKKRETKSKVIVLISDGEDTASSIPYNIITKLAQKYSIKIYTIGIGQSNTKILKMIAKESGAKAFKAQSKKDLKEIYAIINSIEKSEITQNKIIINSYYFFYPLFFAVLSLLFLIFLRNRS
jgi:Ca-activated chloride channel family protein